MRQAEQQAGMSGAESKRVEVVVDTLAQLRSHGETLAEVAHDARNMVTALGLYCDLLEEPGVLTPQYRHFGSELRLVATASRRLVEKLVTLDTRLTPETSAPPESIQLPELSKAEALLGDRRQQSRHWDMMPAEPIGNLAAELMANRNLLSALAGPSITLTMETLGGALPVKLTGEDLTRVLVNMVKNAAEAMPSGGKIHLSLCERTGVFEDDSILTLSIEDSGPGIPQKALDMIFESGYTTRSRSMSQGGAWPAAHRGLGLSITRSILEAAGGSIHAANRRVPGARFEIELPVLAR